MRKRKEKSETRKTANSVLSTAVILLFFAIGFFWTYYVCIRDLNTIEGGVKVNAEIVNVGYRNVLTSGGSGSWYLEYEYIDENGVIYYGHDDSTFEYQEYAMRYIGSKIEIYIDGEGHSIVAGYKPGAKGALITAIVLIVLTIVALAVYIKLLIIDKKKMKENEALCNVDNQGKDVESVIEGTQKREYMEVDITDLQRDEMTTTDVDIEETLHNEKK